MIHQTNMGSSWISMLWRKSLQPFLNFVYGTQYCLKRDSQNKLVSDSVFVKPNQNNDKYWDSNAVKDSRESWQSSQEPSTWISKVILYNNAMWHILKKKNSSDAKG